MTGSVTHINTKEFWSDNVPNCLDKSCLSRLIMKLPVPSPHMLELCCKDINSPTYQPNIKLIIYTHLPSSHSESDQQFPLWILNYWLQVSQLHQFVCVPWRQAKNWAAHQDLLCFPEHANLADLIHKSLTISHGLAKFSDSRLQSH